MRGFTAVPVEEYLSTDYRPDVDYVDGEIVERNGGEKDHSRLQALLINYLVSRESEYGIHVFAEQRIQISPRKYRVPDICVTVGPEPEEQIFTVAPFLCIEIVSPEDRMGRIQQKIDDYLGFGVQYVWLIDPESRAWVYTREGIAEVRDGALRTENPGIAVQMGAVLPYIKRMPSITAVAARRLVIPAHSSDSILVRFQTAAQRRLPSLIPPPPERSTSLTLRRNPWTAKPPAAFFQSARNYAAAKCELTS